MTFLDAKLTHRNLDSKCKEKRTGKNEIFQLPITEVHGVHPQLEVQLLFLVKPKKKVKSINMTQDNI